jgi:fatty acid desaturase
MAETRIKLPAELLVELHRPRGKHWPRLGEFLFFYLAAGGAAAWLAIVYPHHWQTYLACVPLYLLAAGSLHGISLFTHEAVHGTLCKNPVANRALGAICAWPVLQNFAAYQVLHLRHHEHLGLPGDPDHYDNYTHWTWLLFAMHWGRLILGYPAYITAIPILGFRAGRGWERFWIAFESACAIALVVTVILSPIPRIVLIQAWLIPMVIINTLVNIRGMSQHTFLEHQSDPILGTRSILTNRLTAFFMCNENYHLEHHLYPGVPWYNLPRLHRAMRDELVDRGAPYIRSYFAFVCTFVAGSLRRSPLGSGGLGR